MLISVQTSSRHLDALSPVEPSTRLEAARSFVPTDSDALPMGSKYTCRQSACLPVILKVSRWNSDDEKGRSARSTSAPKGSRIACPAAGARPRQRRRE